MDTLLKIIIALSFGGAAALAIWLLVEAADAVLRHKRGKGETKPLKPVDETDPKKGKFNDTY